MRHDTMQCISIGQRYVAIPMIPHDTSQAIRYDTFWHDPIQCRKMDGGGLSQIIPGNTDRNQTSKQPMTTNNSYYKLLHQGGN